MNKLNAEVFKGIKEARERLARAHAEGSKAEQLEAFKALSTLYACLNVEAEVSGDVVADLEKKAA